MRGLNAIIAPRAITTTVLTKPIANVLSMMAMLTPGEQSTGLTEWLDSTRECFTPEQMFRHKVIFWGLGAEELSNAVDCDDSTEFPDYLKLLAQVDAEVIRDKALYWLMNATFRRLFVEFPPLQKRDAGRMLRDVDYYLELFDNPDKHFDKDIPAFVEAHHLLNNPPELKAVLVPHLTELWDEYVAEEWARIKAGLYESSRALQQIDTRGLSVFEAIQVITGRDLRTLIRHDVLNSYKQLYLVPARHNGPYIMVFSSPDTLTILFAARTPAGYRTGRTWLDNNEFINRMKAVADEDRLNILLAIKDAGELSTQDIIERFDLNKSAASRYLGLLYANGLLSERRDSDGKSKFYSLNHDCVDELIHAIIARLKE